MSDSNFTMGLIMPDMPIAHPIYDLVEATVALQEIALGYLLRLSMQSKEYTAHILCQSLQP